MDAKGFLVDVDGVLTFGGEAWAEDNEPEGDVFKVRLPKAT